MTERVRLLFRVALAAVLIGGAARADTNEVSRSDATSPAITVNGKVTTGTVSTQGSQTLAYSTAWQSLLAEADARLRISVRRADGTGGATVLLDQAGPCAGTVPWDVAGLSDGRYSLTYEVLNPTGGVFQTAMTTFTVADALSRADATSPGVAVNGKVTAGTAAVQDAQGIAYSTAWQGVLAEADARIRISVSRADGTGGATVLLDRVGPCAGTVAWSVAGLSDGRYALTYEVLDGTGTAVQTTTANLILAHNAAGGCVVSGLGVNAKAGTQTLFAHDVERLAYSTRWQSLLPAEQANVKVSVQRTNDTAAVLCAVAGSCAGIQEWNTKALVPGRYTLRHEVSDRTGTAVDTLSAQFLLPGGEVALHGGTLATNETWSAGVVHVVTETVIVPSGVTLTIESGAIIKFCSGTGIQVLAGGTLVANGVRFTHFADDTLGGDTNMDGNESKPSSNAYSIGGAGTLTMDSSTELHYTTQQTSGTISGTTTWLPGRTYCITGDITVASGGALTIPAGTILKFSAGKSLIVNSGGTLNAIGTRAQPTIFTSYRDDTYGGDTNGDGANSLPNPGDWGMVHLNGGAGDFAYCTFQYGGGVSGNQYGACANVFCWNNGRGTFNGCTFASSPMDGCFAQNSTFTNCLFLDNDRGLCANNGNVTAINCVSAYNRIGFFNHGSALTVKNSISAFNTGAGASRDYGVSETFQSCCFWNPEATSGNLSGVSADKSMEGNPLFADAETWNFRIQSGSPCIDAGDGAIAPDEDYYGQPRQDIAEVVDSGSTNAFGKCPDIGVYEMQPRNVGADIDLTVANVTMPENATIGEKIRVRWETSNIGSEKVDCSWRDTVSLVSESGQSIELGQTVSSGSIAHNASCVFNAEFTIPAVSEEKWKIRVQVNSQRDVFEGALTENNSVTTSTELTVHVPKIDLSQSEQISLPAEGSVAFCLDSTTLAEGGLLIIHGTGALVVLSASGKVPSSDSYDRKAVEISSGVWLVSFDRSSVVGNLYVTFINTGAADANATIDVQPGSFVLFDSGIKTVSNTGDVTLSVFGVGFNADSDFRLALEGHTISAKKVTQVSEGVFAATFDVKQAPAGDYSLNVKERGETRSVVALCVMQGGIGPKWYCKLDTNTRLRTERAKVGYIEFGNNGDAEMLAPYIKLTSGSRMRLSFANEEKWRDILELMAVSETCPVNILKPGESRRIPFLYKSTDVIAYAAKSMESGARMQSAVQKSGAYIPEENSLNLSYTLSSATAFPWNANAAYMRPLWATDEMWGHILALLRANIGETWDTYLNKMRRNFECLAEQGYFTYRLDAALQMEVNKAVGVDTVLPVLASAIDLTRKARGINLDFQRIYASDIRSRMQSGVFGRGWSYSYDYSATLENNGLTLNIRRPNGTVRQFAKNYHGSWEASFVSDTATLTETNGLFVIKEINGSQMHFNVASGKLSEIKDAIGNMLSFSYNGGKLVSIMHSDGPTLFLSYTGDVLTSLGDDLGHAVRYGYENGKLNSVTAADGLVTRYSYNATSTLPSSQALGEVVFPDGATREYLYDAHGCVTNVLLNGTATALGIERGNNNEYTISMAQGAVSKVYVGDFGEVLRAIDPLKRITSYSYDEISRALTSVLLPNGKRMTASYNANSQPVKTVDPAGNATSFAYTEEHDFLYAFRDSKGHAVSYTYNPNGQRTATVYPDGSEETWEYSEKGDCEKWTNRRGQVVQYVHDDSGRLVQQIWPDGNVFSYCYDAKGNLASASNSLTGTVAFEYDGHERLIKITYPKSRWFEFVYDSAGRVSKRIAQDGYAQCYVYDAFGRLGSVTEGNGALYVSNAYSFADGLLVRRTYGNGTYTGFSYDLAQEVTNIVHFGNNGTVLESFGYTYDLSGRRIAMSSEEEVHQYSYDAIGQLIEAKHPDLVTEQFAYDSVGNRSLMITNGVQIAYTVNFMNQYSKAGNDLLTYDADGNLILRITSNGTTAYEYDVLNRLIKVTRSDGSVWSCRYDALGNRYSVTDRGVTQEFVNTIGALPSVSAEYDSNGVLTRRNVYAGILVADEDATGRRRYYQSDGFNNVCAMTDTNGMVIAQNKYSAFGSVTLEVGEPTDYGYVGSLGIVQDTSGLVYMRNRYYSPDLGRFIQTDPIGFDALDVNFYRYCNNDTLTRCDPTGLSPFQLQGNYVDREIQIANAVDSGDLTTDEALAMDQKMTTDAGRHMSHMSDIYDQSGLLDLISAGSGGPTTLYDLLTALLKWGKLRDKGFQFQVPDLPIDGGLSNTYGSYNSIDPNSVDGPLGLGNADTQRFVTPGQWMDYTVNFENVSNATASAQEVYVDTDLSSYLDWSTFEVGEVSFNNQIELGLVGAGNGAITVDQKGTSCQVKISATVDQMTGHARWCLRSYDPSTADNWPEDPYAGFLPPNDATHRGEGHVSFRVKVRDDASGGARINIAAQIVFDHNTPIATDPTWWNTVAEDKVFFTSNAATVDESDGNVELSVFCGKGTGLTSVAYWILPGTAAAGTDYVAPAKQPQRLAWTNEVGTRTITIPIKADTAVEDAETFYVLLGSATNCAVGEPKVCKVTITDANSGLTLAEALDNALLKWTTGGTAAWLPQTNVTYDGVDAAASGSVASNKFSYVQTSVSGTGTLSYAWSVAGRGVLRLYDGKVLLAAVTNATAWETRSLTLSQNTAHTLKWEFTNLGGTNSFGYLDQVVWLPGGKAGVTVTATASPAEGGAATGSGMYYAGARVPLAATAKPGWLFAGWTPTNLFAKPMTAAQTVTVGGSPVAATANFTKVPVVIGLPNPPEGGTVTGSGLCMPGKSVTLKAAPTAKWAFTSWSDGSQAATRAVAATTDMTLYASFKPISAITAPTVADPGAQSAMVGVLFNLALNVESECLPTVKVSGLPKGLAFNASNLTISGVPSAVPVGGLSTATVSASNPGGNGATVAFAITVSPLDSRAQGTFTGVASDDDAGDNAVRGLLNATVTPQGAFSAKSVMQSGAVRFTSKSWDSASNGVFRATLKTTKGETLSLAQDTASAWNMVGLTGALTGGAFSNSVLSVSGQRGPMSAKTAADYAAGTNVLTRYKGYYTVALPPDDVLEAPGAAGNVPLGSGYLTLTVKDGGAVALVGKLADGTALSGASALIAVADSKAGEAAYVPFLFPLYGAKGVFSGVLEILPGELVGDNVARPCDNFAQAWSYPGKAPASKPTQTEDRFMLSLGMSGGWYNSLTDLRAHYSNAVFSAASSDVTNVYVSGVYTAAVGVVDAALPEVPLAINPATGLISLSSGKAPVYNPATGAYAYAPTNPAVATFKLTKATGIFSGTFNLYYEYRDQTGALKLKTVSVAHAGVLTPVNAEPGTEPAGQGFYLVPDTWKSSDAKPVVYPIKRSYGVEILDGE